jgi:hypothetical protein
VKYDAPRGRRAAIGAAPRHFANNNARCARNHSGKLANIGARTRSGQIGTVQYPILIFDFSCGVGFTGSASHLKSYYVICLRNNRALDVGNDFALLIER